jgi:hypothetical protein
VVKVNPACCSAGTQVVITGGPISNLSQATAVYFGGVSVPFTLNANGTLTATVPGDKDPSAISVAVTVMAGGVLLPSSAYFTYGIGELMVSGPLLYDPTQAFGGDQPWNGPNTNAYSMSLDGLTGSIFFPNFSPVLHLSTSFQDNRPGIPYVAFIKPGPPLNCPWEGHPGFNTCVSAGNGGQYTAYLSVCDVTPPHQTGPPNCNNWDGNTGWWMPASICGSASQPCTTSVTESLFTLGPGKTTNGDLAIPLSSMFPTDLSLLARTLKLTAWIKQLTTLPAQAFPDRSNNISAVFNVVLTPAAMVQTTVIPYTLIYAPPGDQSTVSFTASSQYGSQYSVENDQEIDNQYSVEKDSNTAFSLKASAFFLTGSLDTNSGEVDTTTQGFGQVDSTSGQQSNSLAFSSTWSFPINASLVPGSGAVCVPQTECSQTTTISNPYALEPFWGDTFILFVHPEFAAWTVGSGQTRYAFYGAVQTTIDATVQQLDFCKRGQLPPWGENQCYFEYSTNGIALSKTGQGPVYQGEAESITLSAADAALLLTLDPFYAGGQSAVVATNRALPLPSYANSPYGARNGSLARVFAKTLTNTQAQTATDKAQQSSFSTISSVVSQSDSFGVGVSASGSGNSLTEGLTYTVGSKDTTSNTLKLTYVDSTATSKQNVTQATVTLNDVDNTTQGSNGPLCSKCHAPLPDQPSVNIYLDRLFGTFMFQDTRAPGPPPSLQPIPISVSSLHLMTILTGEEMSQRRFSDVPASDPARGMVGFLAREQIMPGTAKGSFSPNTPMTRGQLATAMASALHLNTGGIAETVFSDVPRGTLLSKSISAAIKANLISPISASTFEPAGSVSREDLSIALAHGFVLTAAGAPNVSDAAQVSSAAASSVTAVLAKGYLKALPDNTFRPTTPVTREDAAAAIYTALYDQVQAAAQKTQ